MASGNQSQVEAWSARKSNHFKAVVTRFRSPFRFWWFRTTAAQILSFTTFGSAPHTHHSFALVTCSAPARLGCCSRAESAAGFGLTISWAPCFERWWANFCNGKFPISRIWIINDRQSPIGNIIRTDPPHRPRTIDRLIAGQLWKC